MKNQQAVLQTLTSIFQELLAPLITILSSCELLSDNVPADINPPLKTIGDVGKKLKNEVHYLYLNVEQEFDLSSSSNTVSQIHEHILRWKNYESTLLQALKQIRKLREAGLRLRDPKLDKILGEIMFNAFEQFQRLLNRLETIEWTDLAP